MRTSNFSIVSFGRFRLSNGMDNRPNYFSKSEISKMVTIQLPPPFFKLFNLKKRIETSTHKYPVSVWIIRAGFFQLSGKSGRIVKIGTQCVHVSTGLSFSKSRVSLIVSVLMPITNQ